MMCHLTAKINIGRCIPNGTKFQAVKSSFKNFRISNPINPKLQGCSLQFTILEFYEHSSQSI